MLWLARSIELDFVHEAVSEVVLVGEVCDHPREVAALGAVVSTAIEPEQAEAVEFPAVSRLVTL